MTRQEANKKAFNFENKAKEIECFISTLDKKKYSDKIPQLKEAADEHRYLGREYRKLAQCIEPEKTKKLKKNLENSGSAFSGKTFPEGKGSNPHRGSKVNNM